MKIKFNLFLTFILILSTGCSNKNLLTKRFEGHNTTQNNTIKLKFISSEGDFGSNISVIVENPDVIKSVWKSIYSAKPTDVWFASGFHQIEFYTNNTQNTPSAILELNASDGAHLSDDLWYHLDSEKEGYYGLWKCSGLNELVRGYLKEEYQRREKGA